MVSIGLVHLPDRWIGHENDNRGGDAVSPKDHLRYLRAYPCYKEAGHGSAKHCCRPVKAQQS